MDRYRSRFVGKLALILGSAAALASANAQDVGIPSASTGEVAAPAAQAAEAAADAAQAAAQAAQVAATVADPYSFLGISWITWSMAVAVALLASLLLLVARSIIRNRAAYLARVRPNPVTEGLVSVVNQTSALVLIIVALAIGAIQLPLPVKGENAVRIAVIIALSIQAIQWGRVFIEIGLKRLILARTTPDGKPDPSLLSAMIPLKFISTIILVAVVALIALDNAGVDVTALVAGLGVGGIAIALAVQSILGDLFSAVSIVIDKPFVVGDFIIVGDKMGTVETIGLKTTRLRALSGEQLIFSNSDLLTSRIQNFKRMIERRVVITVGVTYQTPAPKLRIIPKVVREAVEHHTLTRFDRCHFARYADFSLVYELVYFVKDPDPKKHMDIQQEVLLEIYERFAAEGIEFAYPTQTLYAYNMGTPKASAPADTPPVQPVSL